MSMAWDLSNNIWAIKEEGKTKPSNGTSEERKKAATNNGSNSKSQRNTPIFNFPFCYSLIGRVRFRDWHRIHDQN